MIEQIHQVTGGNFRSVDMIIPRILELEQRNRQKFADGTVRMNEIIKVAAARLTHGNQKHKNGPFDHI